MTGIFDTPEYRAKLKAEMEELERQQLATHVWLVEHRADPPVPVEDLVLERREWASDGVYLGVLGQGVVSLPPVTAGVDYWRYRVYLGRGQAVVGFGKHFTVGVGFFDEPRSEGTNLPYATHASRIWNHIKDNKGTHDVTDEACLRAIELVQEAAVADGGRPVETEEESRARSPYLWDDHFPDCPATRGEHRCVYGGADHIENGETESHQCTCGEEWT